MQTCGKRASGQASKRASGQVSKQYQVLSIFFNLNVEMKYIILGFRLDSYWSVQNESPIPY
jgi:hypothetical protein